MPDTLLGGITISEILVDPNGANNFDTDGSGTARSGDEFIELVNASDSAIDISGLELWDRGRDNWFTFPPGTILEAGASVTVVRNVQNGGSLPTVTGDNLAFDADFGSGVFNNNGDNIVIYDPSNDEYIQATYNGDAVDDPVNGPGYSGFSATATQSGSGEDFGNDQDGLSIQRTYTGFENNDTPTPGESLICFASGTQIETPGGFRCIETLRTGEMVNTLDDGPRPIRWIFARRVTIADLRSDPLLFPIAINHPTSAQHPNERPLLVSRQHRIMISGKIAERMFNTPQILAPAKDLLEGDGVFTDDRLRNFYYFHVLLDDHHVLNANGIAAESLYLGRQSVSSLSREARAELEILFPTMPLEQLTVHPDVSRPFSSGRRVRRLVERHNKNARTLPAEFRKPMADLSSL